MSATSLRSAAVLHNLTDVAGEAEVQLALDETATGANLTRRVELPAHGSLAVDFPVEFKAVGEAKWKWTARFTGDDGKTAFRDAVQTTLKVGYPVALLREVKLSRTEKAETDLLKDADPAVLEGSGVVRVSLGNSRVIELRESLEPAPALSLRLRRADDLEHAAVDRAASDFRDALPELARSDDEIRDAVNRGDRSAAHHADERRRPELLAGRTRADFWGSAYGGLGLAMAQARGLRRADGSVRLAVQVSQRRSCAARPRPTIAAALARTLPRGLHARARGPRRAGLSRVLFKKRAQLTGESRALLALAIIESKGPAAMIEELLRPHRLKASRRTHSGQTRATRRSACSPGASSSRRRRRWRPRSRSCSAAEQGGHWMTTQGNAWSLLALSDYLRKVEKPAPKIDGSLAWGERTEKFALDPKDADASRGNAYRDRAPTVRR